MPVYSVRPKYPGLIRKLNGFEYRNSTQIFVVTIDDNGGYPAEMLAPMIGEAWGVGQKSKDNGIVVLVDMQDRDMFIATGYGNEEYVTDALAGQIVRNEIIPSFKQGVYFEGIDAATDVLISLLEGKFTADEYRKQSTSGGGAGIGGIIFMIILFSIFFGGAKTKCRNGQKQSAPLDCPGHVVGKQALRQLGKFLFRKRWIWRRRRLWRFRWRRRRLLWRRWRRRKLVGVSRKSKVQSR